MAAKKRSTPRKPAAAKPAPPVAAVTPNHPSPEAMAQDQWPSRTHEAGIRAERTRMVAFLRKTPTNPLPGEVWRGKAMINLRDVQAAVVVVAGQPRAEVMTGDGWSEGMSPETRADVFAAYVMSMATLADDLEASLR